MIRRDNAHRRCSETMLRRAPSRMQARVHSRYLRMALLALLLFVWYGQTQGYSAAVEMRRRRESFVRVEVGWAVGKAREVRKQVEKRPSDVC